MKHLFGLQLQGILWDWHEYDILTKTARYPTRFFLGNHPLPIVCEVLGQRKRCSLATVTLQLEIITTFVALKQGCLEPLDIPAL